MRLPGDAAPTNEPQCIPLDFVAGRLLDVERAKESTLSASVVRQDQREGPGGELLYDIEYLLDSTRGKKRILNTVRGESIALR